MSGGRLAKTDEGADVVAVEGSSRVSRLARRARGGRVSPVLLAFVALVLVYGVVYPNLSVVATSLQRGGAWTLANYADFFTRRVALEATAASLGLSLLTVLLCAGIGVPLAFLFERYEFPGSKIFAALAALPLVLPPLVGTVAFLFLFGESGVLARAAQHIFGLERPPWNFTGWPALLIFHAYTMYPFFYVFTGAGLRRLDAGLAEAARSLGASRRAVLARVVLPQLTPSLLAAALLTFMTSMGSFSAPLFFGGDVRVLTLEIFNARQRGDVADSVAQTVVLAAISLGALLLFQRYEGTRRFVAAAMKGATKRRAPLRRGAARTFAALAGVLVTAALLLPVVTLVVVSFARDGVWTTQTLPPEYTLDNYARIFTGGGEAEALRNSVVMSALAAGAALVWSLCVAALVARGRGRWRRAVSLLILVPWALPGTVVAVSIAEAYGRPNPLTGTFILVGTFWILPAVYFLRFMPLVVRSVQASIEQLDPALEEAAAGLGARPWQRLWRVRLPLIIPGAAAGTLLAFVIALGEYVASVLVYVPRNRPASMAIAAAMRDYNLGTASALGVVLVLAIGFSMIAVSSLERRQGQS